MISDDRMQKALTYLAQSDEEYAELKTDVERQEWCMAQAKARVFKLTEGSVADRKAEAELSGDVSEATERWLKAMLKAKKVEAKRATEELVIRTWQTVSANRRQGNI